MSWMTVRFCIRRQLNDCFTVTTEQVKPSYNSTSFSQGYALYFSSSNKKWLMESSIMNSKRMLLSSGVSSCLIESNARSFLVVAEVNPLSSKTFPISFSSLISSFAFLIARQIVKLQFEFQPSWSCLLKLETLLISPMANENGPRLSMASQFLICDAWFNSLGMKVFMEKMYIKVVTTGWYGSNSRMLLSSLVFMSKSQETKKRSSHAN